jgi:putative acetyltransferase
MAAIIQQVLKEFNANKPGTAYFDKSTHDVYNSFRNPAAGYWVISAEAHIWGGGGLYPTEGLPPGYCELVKLYLLPAARGRGWGRQLITHCLQAAAQKGYTHVYLETMPELHTAIPLYEKAGFTYLPAPLGKSGHYGCNVWMVKAL